LQRNHIPWTLTSQILRRTLKKYPDKQEKAIITVEEKDMLVAQMDNFAFRFRAFNEEGKHIFAFVNEK
jgi:hypothetical protein